MGIKLTNNALTKLASGISGTDTTLAVTPGTGSRFPVLNPYNANDYFVVTMENAAGDREFIRVDYRASGSDTMGNGTYPCTRGYWGSSARAWVAGDSVDIRLSAEIVQLFAAGMIGGNNLSEITNAAAARSNLGISATNTPFTPSGGITSNTVQAALAELGTAKATGADIDAAVAAHTAASDPHMQYVLEADTSLVRTSGDQTISGIKTFTASPVLPGDASTPLQAVPKQQLDAAVNDNGLTAETAPAPGDFIGIYDISASAMRKMTIENALKVINLLTEDPSPDSAADFLLSYDASASTVKKIKHSTIGGGSVTAGTVERTIRSGDTSQYNITTPTKKWQAGAPQSGTVRVTFTLFTGGGSCNGRIYKNGVAVGTTRTTGTSGTWSEDISGILVGDLIQIYMWNANSAHTDTLTAAYIGTAETGYQWTGNNV